MRFLNPTGFLALLLAVPVLLLYVLRLHRRDTRVPSILLWEAVLTDRYANRPWQKLRRNWLLLLQLLVLLALVLGLVRPAVPAPQAFHGQMIVLLDASASMQAIDDDGLSRFDLARRELRSVAAALDPGDRVSLIAVGPVPRLLLQGGDAQALRRMLDDLAPTDGGADWRAAAALAAGVATGDAVTTLLVTDAAFDKPIPALPGDVRLIAVGAGATNGALTNVGLVAFALRRAGEGLAAFARLTNAGPATVRTLSLYADGVLVERRSVNLPPLDSVSVSFTAVPVTAWAEVRLDGSDALAVDDRAWVALSASGSGSALLVTPGNRFLAQALRALPDLTLAESTSLEPAAGDRALIVVDGLITTTMPVTNSWLSTNLWLIAPDAGTPCGEPGAVITPTTRVRGRWTHPLLQYVDWGDVHISRARAYSPPDDAGVLVETASGPLLWTVERPGQRIVCTAFDLHDSDLPLRLAFPILTANLVGWLLPQTSVEPVVPYPSGVAWSPDVPPAATAAVLVTSDDRRVPVNLDAGRTDETAAGLYRIEAETPAGTAVRYAALALLDAEESDLRPRDVRVGSRVLPLRADAAGWRDVGGWFVALALGLVLVEAAVWWWDALRRRFGVRPGRSRPLRSAGTLVLRVVLLALLVLALLGARWARRTRDLAVVFVLDRSASTRAAWDAQVAFVEDALSQKSPRDRAALVVFGGDAWVDRPLSTSDDLAGIATLPRAGATDIESAVRLGLALLPDGAPGRLVLLTDGLETSGAAAWALREAGARGVDLRIVMAGSGGTGSEVWISDLRLPARVYLGDRVPVMVEIAGNASQPVGLTWSAGGQTGQGALDLTGSTGALAFSFAADAAGFVPLRACVAPVYDTFAQNNCADGWVMVQGAPRVLVVGQEEERAALIRALARVGLEVEAATPERVPLTAQGLADYAGVVLVNTPARRFAPQSLVALRTFVRDLGGGLVAVGGPQSYGVGGWLGTPLEDALPVEMRVQDPRRFPPLAMVVVIDKSGSMAAPEAGTPKIRLAAEAAIRVAETLNDADTLAIVAFDDRPADTFGPVTMQARDALIARLRRLQAGGGGIYVRESLAYATGLLDAADLGPETQRHILLLADGADAEHQEQVVSLVADYVAGGTTVSVVAIGAGSDVPFLTQVAGTGAGRFYLTQRAADLPAIFAEEAARAKRSYIVEETFYPTPVTPWPPVDGITAVPSLRGYVAATPKDAAQVVWSATQDDPLLAVWQYGLGRSVAWTSDATGRWAADWVGWEAFAQFWSGVVRSVLPAPADAGLALRVVPDGDAARVLVDVTAPDGSYVDGLDLQLQAVAADAGAGGETVTLAQRAPGRYEGRFTLPGREALLLRLFGDRSLVAGWAASAPAEYVPGDVEAAMARLASQGGGALVDDPAAVFVHDVRGRERGQPLAPLLVALVALLWPVDIAWRRLALTRSDVARGVQKVQMWQRARRRRRDALPSEVPATLAANLRRQHRHPSDTTPGESSKCVEQTGATSQDVFIAGERPALSETASAQRGEGASPSPETQADDTLAARLKRRLRD